MKKLGICIIGCGAIAKQHAKTVNQLGLDLYFASRDFDKAEDYAEEFNAMGYFGSYDSAVKDSRVDAVILCTPHDLHLAGVKLAAKHKKHVLVEKPIAASLKDASEMIVTARKAGITLMVAENFHFLPAVEKIKKLVQDNEIGRLRFMQINNFSCYQADGWRGKSGIFFDMGVHFANVIRNIAGGIKSVQAVKPLNTLNIEAEDSLFVVGKTDKDVVFEVNASWATRFLPKIQPSMITGTTGTIFFDTFGRFVLLWGNKKRLYIYLKNPMYSMLKEFIESIQQKREPAVTGEDAKKDLAFVLAAHESVKAGKGISLG